MRSSENCAEDSGLPGKIDNDTRHDPAESPLRESHGGHRRPNRTTPLSQGRNGNTQHHWPVSVSGLWSVETMTVQGSSHSSHSTCISSTSNTSGRAVLCASCDACRARKTKCDGQRPCSHCISRYKKQHALPHVDDGDLMHVPCVYSPAKRRGPAPSHPSSIHPIPIAPKPVVSIQPLRCKVPPAPSLHRKIPAPQPVRSKLPAPPPRTVTVPSRTVVSDSNPPQCQPHNHSFALTPNPLSVSSTMGYNEPMPCDEPVAVSFQQPERASLPPRMAQDKTAIVCRPTEPSLPTVPVSSTLLPLSMPHKVLLIQPRLYRGHALEPIVTSPRGPSAEEPSETMNDCPELPLTVTPYLPLLDHGHDLGSRLRASYQLVTNDMVWLPGSTLTRTNALSLSESSGTAAAQLVHWTIRFTELSLGAVARTALELAMELHTAALQCWSRVDPTHFCHDHILDVAKAMMLLGIFQIYQGNTKGFFEYRDECLFRLSPWPQDDTTMAIMAAVSYTDAWVQLLPNDADAFHSVTDPPVAHVSNSYVLSILDEPWAMITGRNAIDQPKVFHNVSAPTYSRSLDAIAFVIRNLCASGSDVTTNEPPLDVEAMHGFVRSARSLLATVDTEQERFDGLYLTMSALDVFLDVIRECDEHGDCRLDHHIQSLLAVCNGAVYRPQLLFHGSPTYHMVSNAALLLYRILTGMNALKAALALGPDDQALLDEVHETYVAVRKLLTVHRRKLPTLLQCHLIPTARTFCHMSHGGPSDNGPKLCTGPFCRQIGSI